MLLDRIDIDVHGPLQRVELGPFSEHLNVVLCPQGAGKTAIARFVRDSLVERDYPLGMLSSSTGRVVFADGNGLVHCRREKDGTAQGRRTVEFESRGDWDRRDGLHENAWLRDIGSSTESSRAMESIRVPESIVDSVITDTALTSVARVVAACVRSGLDCPDTYRSLPLTDDSVYHDRNGHRDGLDEFGERRYDQDRQLRARLADVEAELADLGDRRMDHDALVARRDWLTSRLARTEHSSSPVQARSIDTSYDRTRYASLQSRLSELQDQVRHLRARQSELRRWISEIDRDDRKGDDSTLRHTHYQSGDLRNGATEADKALNRQIEDLDAQMIHWRQTLAEVRGLRQVLFSKSGSPIDHPLSPLDERSLRRLRVEGFLHAVDRYGSKRHWDDLYPESHRSLHRLDDIEHRVDSATRQIDWLLNCYAGKDKPRHAWYESSASSHRTATTLGDTLRAIRNDLLQIHRHTQTRDDHREIRPVTDLEEFRRSEAWLVSAMDQLNRHRENLLRTHPSISRRGFSNGTSEQHSDRYALDRERVNSVTEIDRVTAELDARLCEAVDVRRSLRSLPVIETRPDHEHDAHDRVDRDAWVAELRRVDQRLSSLSRVQRLRSQRSQLLEQLGAVRKVAESRSPLADSASRWLIRLTAGRLRRIDWSTQRLTVDENSYHQDHHRPTGVMIQGRDETECPAADRSLAVMAVRMAAGDLLARTGRHVPLVLETHSNMLARVATPDSGESHPYELGPAAYYHHGDHLHSNHPIAAALRDYTRGGRQLIVMTGNEGLAAQLTRVGACRFEIQAERVVHAHRPIWKSPHHAEHYTGPHPHTYGFRDADELTGDLNADLAMGDGQTSSGPAPVSSASRGPASRGPAPSVNVNRDFDMAWRETYGYSGTTDRVVADSPSVHSQGRTVDSDSPSVHSQGRTDWARDGVDYRDGFYFTDTFTSVEANGRGQSAASGSPAKRDIAKAPASPFYLSVDSPIDQAPSVDAVASARLRGLQVTHINHLMQQDSNRLADALGLASVDAATIRRWQSECRLVCRVPHLRGFDARVLVGCGITTPAQLSSTHPVDLLHEVEAFLATERGQQILLSGSSHELSRITSWIAAANSKPESEWVGMSPGQRQTRDRRQRIIRTMHERDAAVSSNGKASRRAAAKSDQKRRARSEGTNTNHSSDSRGQGRSRRRRRAESETNRRDVVRYENDDSDQTRTNRGRSERRRATGESSGRRADRTRELRFYLHRENPVVDAPSIGDRMAERLQAIEIVTVDDLLNADPDTVASELDHRRVDADTVVQWQQQAALVCCVPMLRGHDAQLLVAAEVVTPEDLANSDAEDLFGIIDPIANSREGKRILRGGKLPDLEEVTEWVGFAQHTRELKAA